MNSVSVVIITLNEENNIERCLQSVTWADEIIVLDTGSSDRTIELCHQFKCKVISSEWLGFGKTKQKAVSSASHDWILSLDADEVITPVLASEISSLYDSDPPYQGYRIRRRSFYLGKPIRFCGWQKDKPLRLFNKRSGSFNTKPVHESVTINGRTGLLREYMLHYTYPDRATHFRKMRLYAELGAQMLRERGKRSSFCEAWLRGILKFLKMYVWGLGFLDGKAGLNLCLHSAWGVYYKYRLVWEKSRSE